MAGNLPRGLAVFDPAFIQVIEFPHGGIWEVQAVYVRDGTNVTLWRTKERPTWVGKLRQEK